MLRKRLLFWKLIRVFNDKILKSNKQTQFFDFKNHIHLKMPKDQADLGLPLRRLGTWVKIKTQRYKFLKNIKQMPFHGCLRNYNSFIRIKGLVQPKDL